MIQKKVHAFRRVPRGLFVISLALFLWGLGEGLFIYFLPLALQHWRVDAGQIGLTLGMMGLPMVFIQLPAGYLADHIGTRPLVITAMLLGIAAAVLMGFAHSLPVFVAGTLIYGFVALFGPPLHSEITALRGDWSVQKAVTFVSASMQAGAVLGPIVGGRIASATRIADVFRFSAVLFITSLFVICLTNRIVRKERKGSSESRKTVSFSRSLLWYVALVFLSLLILYIPQQLSTLYLNEVHQIQIERVGTLGTIANLGAVAIMYGLGSLSPRIGMQIGMGFVALFSFLLWRGKSMFAFALGFGFLGGGKLYLSMAEAFSLKFVRADQIGFAYGLVATCNALAVSAAPMLAGKFYDFQPASLYLISLAGLLVLMMLTYVFFKTRGMQVSGIFTKEDADPN